jgi:DNA-binding NarL/FixJ family response regulator
MGRKFKSCPLSRGDRFPGAVPLRVFHGDDSEPFRRLIAEVLPDGEEIVMCGDAATPDEVLAGVEREQPDVVLLDQLDGPDLIERLRERAPGVRIVLLSGFRPGHGDAELEGRADGYLVKTAGIDEMRAAVRGG